MEIRNAVHPDHAARFDTAQLRDQFLIQDLFTPDGVKLVYSYFDRLIVGGVCPVNPLMIEVDDKIIGAPFLLARRELGVINVGAEGAVTIDGKTYEMSPKDGLYVGMGAEKLEFSSADKKIRPVFTSIARRPICNIRPHTFLSAKPRRLNWVK